MNVLFVTGMFVGENACMSGMPNYIYKTAAALRMGGVHNTYILTADEKTNKWEYEGIPVYSVKTFPRVSRFAWIAFGIHAILRDYALQRELKKLVKELNIDIIQYAGWFGVGLLHSRRIGIPAVMRMSSYAKVQLASAFTPKQINVISKMERWASRNMDSIFAPSKVIANSFAKDIQREVRVIETAFHLEINERDWDFVVYNEKMKEKKYFLFFGRLSPDKGICTIARSVHQILEEHKDIYFVFAGDLFYIGGENVLNMLWDYGKQYKDRIIYLGTLPKKQIYPIIKKAYAVLCPSLMDNFPNACMEAMYLRKVVIGTIGTSLDELIEDNISGMLIEPDHEELLICKMNELLGMQLETKRRMEEQAHERIMKLKPEIAIKELEEYYKNVQYMYKGRE